jgi:hypothetical protein
MLALLAIAAFLEAAIIATEIGTRLFALAHLVRRPPSAR